MVSKFQLSVWSAAVASSLVAGVQAQAPLGQFASHASAVAQAAAYARPVAQLPQAVTPARVVWSSARTNYPGHDSLVWGGAAAGSYGPDPGGCQELCCTEECEPHRCALVESWQRFWHSLCPRRHDPCHETCHETCAPPIECCDPCAVDPCCESEKHGLFSGYYLRKIRDLVSAPFQRDDCCPHEDPCALGCCQEMAEGDHELGGMSAEEGLGQTAPLESLPPAGTIVIPRENLYQNQPPAGTPDAAPQNWKSRRPARGTSRSSAEEVPAQSAPADAGDAAEGPAFGPIVPSGQRSAGQGEESRPAEVEERTARRELPATTTWF